MSSVTVADLDKIVESIQTKKLEVKALDAQATEINKEIARLEEQAGTYLKELGRDNYKAPGGTVFMKRVWRVGLPKTDEDKAALFDWLRGQGIFDRYATVNSASLNALYKAEWEAAKERGEGLEFSMPGVGEPKLFETTEVRKA